jgi:LuxR family maltose regulon positive regulatory protein
VAELYAGDLRFTQVEAGQLLREAGAPPISADVLQQLVARTDGWPAGLRLASLALAGHPPGQAAQLALAFGGSHPHVASYLVAEVLEQQPEALQRFLLETSVLAYLTAELCDAVTGRSQSAALLADPLLADVLVIQHADGTYRYPMMFAEAMRAEAARRLGREHIQELYRRAARWYAAHGRPADAVEAALAAGDARLAVGWIDGIVASGDGWGEIRTIRRWVEQLPADMLPDHPAVCMAYASAILFTEDRAAPETMRRLEVPLELAEHGWRAAGNQHQLGRALIFRAIALWWQDEQAQAARSARHALGLLADDDHWWRGAALLQLALEARSGGRIDEAERLAHEAHACVTLADGGYLRRAIMLTLCDCAIQRGQLHEAAQLAAHIGDDARDDPEDRGQVALQLAGLALLAHDTQQAAAHVAAALEIALQAAGQSGVRHNEGELVIPVLLVRAQLLVAQGAFQAAQEVLGDAAARAKVHNSRALRRQVDSEQARISLMLGNVDAVERWAALAARSSDDVPRFQQEREALVVARWLVARGETESALRALTFWRDEARAQGRVLSELETQALSALAYASAGRRDQAASTILALLPRVHALGVPHLLLRERQPMRDLLAQLSAAHAGSPEWQRWAGYLARVVALFPPTGARPAVVASAALTDSLPEPLSQQEQRVLRLLSAGLSNPEIADQLVISVNTVKTHVQSVYRKLGIASRREARAMAQQLGLR